MSLQDHCHSSWLYHGDGEKYPKTGGKEMSPPFLRRSKEPRELQTSQPYHNAWEGGGIVNPGHHFQVH